MTILGRWSRRGQPGTGAIPCTDDPRDHGFADIGIGAEGDANLVSNLEPFIRVVRNQSRSSTCGGQALAGAWDVVTKESEHADDYGPGSALFPYYNGLRLRGRDIVDAGIDLRSLMRAAQKLGIPDETFWPFELSKVTRCPDWQAFFRAAPRRGIRYAFIRMTGMERVAKIASCLHTGLPVIIGTNLDRAFFVNEGPKILQVPSGEIIGRHFLLLVAHSPGLNRILNSWGRAWRDNGLAYLTDEYLASVHVWDPCVLYGCERVLRGEI